MGWDFTEHATKKDIIERLTRDRASYKCIAKAVRGNVLWTVEDITCDGSTHRIIGCYLLGSERGFGWGYKDMCESMGPYQLSCPIKFLDMAPVANAEWREKVRAHAEAEAAKRAVSKTIQPGTRVKLVDGCHYAGYRIHEAVIVSVKPLVGDIGFTKLRMKRRQIAAVLPTDS